jgi:hypothetical protein
MIELSTLAISCTHAEKDIYPATSKVSPAAAVTKTIALAKRFFMVCLLKWSDQSSRGTPAKTPFFAIMGEDRVEL